MGIKPIKGIEQEKYFRWRGKEVSRTENLSDIVFAMALALIVASSVPESFTELVALWREGIAIAICFALLLMIWHIHFVFFRRYDLEDSLTIFLNAVLMFLVMAFVYPLKFLFLLLVNFFTGNFENQQAGFQAITAQQAPWISIIYALGYAAVFVVFTAMYIHALRQAVALKLNAAEIALTRTAIFSNLVHIAMSALVICVAIILPNGEGLRASALFMFIGIPLVILAHIGRRKAQIAFEAENPA